MTDMSEAATLIGMVSSLVGLMSGIAIGSWTAAGKNKDLLAHGKAIETISARCERQKDEIINEVKATICDAIKVLLRDLKIEMSVRQQATERELAVAAERISQAEKDIDALFSRVRDLEKTQ